MNEMMERVARAIADGVFETEEQIAPVLNREDFIEVNWEDFVVHARRVLEAMRESTHAMDLAAEKLGTEVDGVWQPALPEFAWTAMIDSALTDTQGD